MEVVREGRIILHLETGKVELKAPAQLDAMVKSRERYLELMQRIAAEEERLARIQATQAAAASSGSRGGGFTPSATGGGRGSVPDPSLATQYAAAIERAHKAQMMALSSVGELGEGIFRLGRAAVLLSSSSDESFNTMIRGLAKVQAYYDLFAGSTKIVVALNRALHQLALAQQAVNAAVAIAKAQGFGEIYDKATVPVIAFFTKLGPLGAALVVLTVVVLALVSAWDALTTSASEAEAAQKQAVHATQIMADQVAKAVKIVVDARKEEIDAYRKLADARRAFMTDEERATDLSRSTSDIGNVKQFSAAARDGKGDDPSRLIALNFQNDRAYGILDDLQERLHLQEHLTDAAVKEREEKIRAIEAQERLVDATRKQVEAEEKKLRSFQAQVGALNAIEQQQLKDIATKLRAGKDITVQEEDFFARNAGERGQSAIDDRRAKRGAAAGFDDNFFDGITGAGTGLKEASSELAKVVAALEKLTAGLSAEEAKQKLKDEITAQKATLDAVKKEIAAFAAELIEVIAKNNTEIAHIKEAITNGTYR